MSKFTPNRHHHVTVLAYPDEHGQWRTVDTNDLLFNVPNQPVVAAEQIIDPLPTTLGSVVRWDDRTDNPHSIITRTLVRTSYPCPWADVNDMNIVFADFDIEGATILFDAGAE